MIMLLRLAWLKAFSPMLVTIFGIVKEFPVFPDGYVCKRVLLLLYKTPFSEVYALFPELTFIAKILVKAPKALLPMLVTLFGIVTLVRLEQPENALSPMLVILSCIVTLARLEQLEKVQLSMLVTLYGIVTLTRLKQFTKVPFPILVTLFGIFIPISVSQPLYNGLPVLKAKYGIAVIVLPVRSRLTYLFGAAFSEALIVENSSTLVTYRVIL
jgi:hypothetical protein